MKCLASKLTVFLLGGLWAGYKALIAPALGPCCRYYPSCSQYFMQSVSARGIWRGALSGVGRILRCHPFSAGGYDPVEHFHG